MRYRQRNEPAPVPPAAKGGVSSLFLLTILFIGLKLTGFISWSWVWVLAPTWIPVAFIVAIVILVNLIVFTAKEVLFGKKTK